MRAVIFCGLLACLAVGAARAGRNANGALVVHTDNAIIYTSSADYCASALPQICEQLNPTTSKLPEEEIAIVWFLAAFRPEADPSVATIQFGVDHDLPAGQGYLEDYAACGPGILELPDLDWPEGGGDGVSGNLVSFSIPSTQKVFPFYWFAVIGEGPQSRFGSGAYPSTGEAKFVDGSSPPVEDYCARFGVVRWGAPGENDCPPVSNCVITVTSPNGGESWEQGSLQTITWGSSQCDGPMRIDLLREGILCNTIAAAAPNTGSFGWIPQQCNGALSGYRIRLTDLGGGRTDESNAAFSIPTGSCQLFVESPNGEDRFDQGSPVSILWGSTNCGSSVTIELVRDGGVCRTIASGTENDGSFEWIAQPCGGECGYKLRVTDAASGLAGETNGTFCIDPCAPLLSAPNGGESWLEATERTILWDAPECGDLVRLELVRAGSVCATIATETPNDGSHPWIVQSCGGSSDGYAVRVCDLASGECDESDAPFEIPICRLDVEAPNGGESWPRESVREILWSPSDCGGEAKIELLRNGTLCSTISAGTPNDGAFSWVVQQCSGATSGYKIRITDLATGTSDASDAAFSIPDPSCQLTVVSPNGGEEWVESTPREITWSSRFCGETVKLELVRAGTVCAVISSSTTNDGRYTWTASRCGGFSDEYRIRVTDLELGGFDESDSPFAIVACRPTVVFPNGGEEIPPGSAQTIQWSSASCEGPVKIQLLRNGLLCEVIAESTPNDGSHPWTAEMCDGSKTGYRIRIRDLVTQVADESDAVFCIGCGEKYYFPDSLRVVQGATGFEIPLMARNDQPLRSLSLEFCFDPAILQCTDLSIDGTRASDAVGFTKSCAAGCAAATIDFGASCPPQLEAGDGPILRMIVDVAADAPLGASLLDLIEATPPVNTMTSCDGLEYRPTLIDGAIEISLRSFIRGDTDGDAGIDIADVIACLSHQFSGGEAPACLDAADTDDSGRIDIADCLASLCAQFGDCPPLPLDCAVDATAGDPLDCASFAACDGLPRASLAHAAEGGGRIVLREAEGTGPDTIRVAIGCETSDPLTALQCEIRHDPSRLAFLGFAPSLQGADFLRARASADGRIRIGCIPDLTLERSIPAGVAAIAEIRFLRLRHDEGASWIEASDGQGVRLDRTEIALSEARIEVAPPPPAGPESAASDVRIDLPNPFTESGEIRVSIPAPVVATIEIFDVAGRRSAILHEGPLPAGVRSFRWPAAATAGTGVYWIRVVTPEGRSARSVVVLF